jgi:hypothetical protein
MLLNQLYHLKCTHFALICTFLHLRCIICGQGSA